MIKCRNCEEECQKEWNYCATCGNDIQAQQGKEVVVKDFPGIPAIKIKESLSRSEGTHCRRCRSIERLEVKYCTQCGLGLE